MIDTSKNLLSGAVFLTAMVLVPQGITASVALQEPSTVIMKNGRQYTGDLAGLNEGRLAVAIVDGGGEVQYFLPVEEVASVRFSGEEESEGAMTSYRNNEYDRAIPQLEAIYRQRLPYLPVLNPDQEKPLVALVKAYRAVGADIDAVVTARRLGREIQNSVHRETLVAIQLAGYLDLDLADRAAEEARAWCARQERHPDSALGWHVLAELALREERFEEALWIALQPIAFATADPMEYLNYTYAAALRACREIGEERLGMDLFREMRERDLAVPKECPHASEATGYFAELWDAENNAAQPVDDTGPLIDPRPPQADLNLPLRDVRRLLLALPDI